MKANMKPICNVLASILLAICLCISMVGCADNQAAVDPTNESVAVESTGNVTEPQIPDETDAATEPATEESAPTETESTATETIHNDPQLCDILHQMEGAVAGTDELLDKLLWA